MKKITREEMLALVAQNKKRIEREKETTKLKKELDLLNEDLIQFAAGVFIPNIEEKRAEFRRIHGDIRELEGKPRERPNAEDEA